MPEDEDFLPGALDSSYAADQQIRMAFNDRADAALESAQEIEKRFTIELIATAKMRGTGDLTVFDFEKSGIKNVLLHDRIRVDATEQVKPER